MTICCSTPTYFCSFFLDHFSLILQVVLILCWYSEWPRLWDNIHNAQMCHCLLIADIFLPQSPRFYHRRSLYVNFTRSIRLWFLFHHRGVCSLCSVLFYKTNLTALFTISSSEWTEEQICWTGGSLFCIPASIHIWNCWGGKLRKIAYVKPHN